MFTSTRIDPTSTPMQSPDPSPVRRPRDGAHAALRSRTRADHEAVDAAFAHHDLGDRDGYAGFLTTHARVLPALEAALDPAARLDGWTGRTGALLADLHALDLPVPAPLPVHLPPGDAARWGAIYVLEGSRLGGLFLARQVGEGLPKAYLSAAHRQGGWQHILAAIEDAAQGPDWLEDAVHGARQAFGLFAAAAARAPRDD